MNKPDIYQLLQGSWIATNNLRVDISGKYIKLANAAPQRIRFATISDLHREKEQLFYFESPDRGIVSLFIDEHGELILDWLADAESLSFRKSDAPPENNFPPDQSAH